jgi:hypothetical protein
VAAQAGIPEANIPAATNIPAANSPTADMSPLVAECSFSATGFAAWDAGKGAVALVTGEQLKHGSLDSVRRQLDGAGGALAAHASTLFTRQQFLREQLVVEQARHGRRDRFPRNSFFT